MAKRSNVALPASAVRSAAFPKLVGGPLGFSVLETPDNLVRRARRHHARGLKHAKAGRWEPAAREFEEAARTAPDQPDFNFALGGALSQLGRVEEAMAAYQRELAILPGDAPALAEFGGCLARLGRRAEAILCLEAVLQNRPDMPYAHYNLGLALLSEHRRLDAIEALGRAIALNPSYADAHRLRGLAHAMGDEGEKAAIDMQAALAIDNKDHEAMLVAGELLNRKASELEAGRLFELAARVAPNIAFPQFVLGHFLIAHRRYEDGMAHVDRALTIDPLLPEAHAARGYGCLGQGRIDEAVASYRHAAALRPDDANLAGNLLFALQHKPGVTKADLFEAHRNWAALYRPQAPRDRRSFGNDRSPDRPLRIGLVSADLRRHAVAFLTLRAFESLSARGYELYCYKTDRKFADDAFSDRFKAIARGWRDVSDLDDAALAALIEEQKIDILLDLSGHTAGCRLGVFAMRAAPVQLSWAGYVGTIGLDTYDGVIADPVEIPPDHDSFYVEPIVRLPDCYVCYLPPEQAPAPGPLPVLEKKIFTFGCLNRPAKLNSAVARAWAQILERTPRARILLAYGGLQEATTRDSVYRVLESGGLTRDRVDVIGETDQSKLLEIYATRVDLALDPFPYSGGVTTLEAMWMGVSTVTLVGDTFAGRHSASHLTAAGLADFCCGSVEDYVELAASWARRPQELAQLRAGLRDKLRASPLCDASRFGENLDIALRGAWRRWAA
ncbi:tetratricopeptide repeat protein [Methylosinus sp. Sm6]|uniref:tetratricopeptide repeat protein n=1 Tax=Methylosinus sp. Sm6 TaxID=2866948 RepID=UPI001C99C622|nr:tetratricopeptide repeat protein [Methylosinus sp. Sm6]MBY6240841.1 tetratricopeptide repeat protein [Methylosinus sp. Sm6]